MTLKPSGNLDVSGLVISDSGPAPGATEALRIVRGTVASDVRNWSFAFIAIGPS